MTAEPWSSWLPEDKLKGQIRRRRARNPNPAAVKNTPRNPMRGSELAVLGKLAGAGSGAGAAAATAFGAGAGSSMSSTPTCVGVGGGGGAVPVTARFWETTTSGVVVTTVAETFIPFRKSKTVFSWPSMLNLVPSGTLYCLFSPLGSVRITLFPLACHTFPLTVLVVVTVRGVVVVVIVRCSFIPGFRS
jgi:hypothetical protein